MASRQDDNQFDDADFEDAESDLLTSKGILSQDSGYMNDIDPPSLTRTNGDLPESENAESDCGGEISEEVNGGDDVMNNYSEEDHYHPGNTHDSDGDYQVDYNGHRANGYADDDQRYTHEEVTESDRIYQDDRHGNDDVHDEEYQEEHHPRSEVEESHQMAEEDYTQQEYDTNIRGGIDGEVESEAVEDSNANPVQEYYSDDVEKEVGDQGYVSNQVEYTESDLPDSLAISTAGSSEGQGADIEYNPAAQDDFEEDSYQDEPDQWMECDSVELTTPGANPTHIEEEVGLNQTRQDDSVEADQDESPPILAPVPSSETQGYNDHSEPIVMELKSEPVVIEQPPVLDQDNLDDKFNDDIEDKFIDVEDINDMKEPDIPDHEDKFRAIVPDPNSFKPISVSYETKSVPDRTQVGERKEVTRKSPTSPPRLSPTMPIRREQQKSPNNTNTAVPMQKNATTTPSSQAQRKVMRQAPGAATRAAPEQAQSQLPRSQQAPHGERRTLSQNYPLSPTAPPQNTDRSPMVKLDRRQDTEQAGMGMKSKTDAGGNNGSQRSMKPAPGSAKPIASLGNANPVASLKSRLQSERQAMLELEKTLAVAAQQNNVQQQARRTQNTPRRPASGGSSEQQKTSPVSARHNDEYASVSSLRRGQETRPGQDNRWGQQDANHRSSPASSPSGNSSQAIPQQQSTQLNRSPRPPPQRSSPDGGRTPPTTKPSTSPVRRVTGPARLHQQQQQTRQEQPRNNSNANHLPAGARLDQSKSNSIQGALTQGNSATNNRPYAYDVQETQSNASGEVVFDDCAECGAYLEDKIMTYQDEPPSGQVEAPNRNSAREYRAAPPKQFGPRRRRNSYELANRMSSSEEEDDDDINGLFTPAASHLSQHRKEDLSSLIAANGGKYDNVDNKLNDDRPTIPSTGVDDTLLAKLAERELANLWKSHERLKPSESTDSGIRQDSSRQSTASDYSSPPMTPGEHNNRPEPRKVLPNISPMEYDVIGLRLAGHSATINENNMNISSNPPQPEEDQFSDAEESDMPAASSSNPNGNSDQYVDGNSTYSGSSLDYGTETPDSGTYSGRNMRSTNHDQGPQVNIKETMKELQDALSTSKSALMKTPSFYVQEAPPEPVWILQPHTVKKMAEDARKARITEERKKRQDELRQIRQQQRTEILQNTNPQCYQREEDEDEDGLENRQLMSDRDGPGSPAYNRQQRSMEPDTMRAPDLPPATGKIKEALNKGILYPAAYLGSTQLVTTKQPTKKVRMQQAQEAVNRIKSPDGEDQPSTEVDLAISNERIRVLNADTQETMMDHPLKSISYIADIGNIVVIMARRRTVTRTLDEAVEDSGVSMDAEGRRQPRKIICHVFETEDAQLIAQTIGQAFALAYLEFLKANGIEDPHVFEMDYHDVLNSQEIYGDDLMLFSNKECEKEVLVEKERGEIMGMVIVESGWGSLVPTVVIANMSPFGAAARSGKLNIGDQIMSINGTSLVGLPLAQCQQIIKSLKSQCLVKFNMVSCPPVTQVLIKRPDTKYQLGFSVQNGIICSLMRGGIAERGGVRVGHRIIEINGTSVVATAHEKIVEMLSTSIGEIRMKTMPLSMYKLLTGQEQPVYI